MIQPRENVVDIFVKAALGEPIPRALMVPKPPVFVKACFMTSLRGLISFFEALSSATAPFFGGAAAAKEIGGFGGQVYGQHHQPYLGSSGP